LCFEKSDSVGEVMKGVKIGPSNIEHSEICPRVENLIQPDIALTRDL